MKESWIAPKTEVQHFMANEYVAACGYNTVTGNYLFTCDAPAGNLYTKERNYWGEYRYIGQYHPCSKPHETPTTDDFVDGFVDYNKNGKPDDGEDVIVWLEPTWLGVSGHATMNLDRSIWEEKVQNS